MYGVFEYNPVSTCIAGRRFRVEVREGLPTTHHPDNDYYRGLYEQTFLVVQELAKRGRRVVAEIVPDNMDAQLTWAKIAKRFGHQQIQNNPSTRHMVKPLEVLVKS